MPPNKRKVSFSPVEEQIDSPSPAKKRAPYQKRTFPATAATSRPKRGQTEGSAKETQDTNKKSASSDPRTSVNKSYKRSENVRGSKSRPSASISSRPGSSSLANSVTPGIVAKRGRGRPKKNASEKLGATSKSPSVVLEIPAKSQEVTEKKRGRGRPKKATEESKSAKGTYDSVKGVPPREPDEYPVANYDDEDLKEDRSYWLMKAEPETRYEKGVDVRFSIDDLRGCPEPEPWDGVRNPAARNNMRAMRKGDYAFFYHSNCKVPGIAGIMEIVREHSVDETAFDTSHPYFDPKSDPNHPKWDLVHVEFRRKFKNLLGLAELKSYGKPGGALENLQMVKQSRLSVSAVTAKQWKFIMSLVPEEDDSEAPKSGVKLKKSLEGSKDLMNGDEGANRVTEET